MAKQEVNWMYFPENMTFQYFFFTTYIGYFLQMIPIALLACILSIWYQRKRNPGRSWGSVLLGSLFPAYMAALIGLTLFSQIIGDLYYVLFYHQSPWPVGEGGYRWFTLVYDFHLDFFRHFSTENLGNLLLFFPFGLLHPLFNPRSTWKRTFGLGVLTCFVIENVQPLMDRSFDLNDIVLNSISVAISTTLFFLARHWVRSFRHQ